MDKKDLSTIQYQNIGETARTEAGNKTSVTCLVYTVGTGHMGLQLSSYRVRSVLYQIM